jgi:uncharacterized protein
MQDNDMTLPRSARAFAFALEAKSAYGRARSSMAYLATAAALAACWSIAWGISSIATATEPAAGAADTELRAFEQGCELGDGMQCNDLGVSYLHGYGVPVDVAVALRAFERSCGNESADGCGNLGALYESGVGVQANLATAAQLYERACSMGAALGCSNLGALYARGRGVAHDLDRAQRLFTRACETGSAAGCTNLMQVGSLRL